MAPLLVTSDADTRREVLAAARAAGVDIQTAVPNRAGIGALLHEHSGYLLLLGADAVDTVAPVLGVVDDVIVVGTDAQAVHTAATRVQRTITVTMTVLPQAAKHLANMLAASVHERAAA